MAQNVYANGNCWASAGVIYLRACLWQCCDNCKTKRTNSFSLQFSSFCCIFLNVFQIKYRQLRPDWGAKRHGLIAFDCIFICMGKRESFFNHFYCSCSCCCYCCVCCVCCIGLRDFSFCTVLSCSYFYAFCQHSVVSDLFALSTGLCLVSLRAVGF